jgi:predicted transport protein
MSCIPIYTEEGGLLKKITEQKFVVEKDLQRLVEKNIETLFEIRFVGSEFDLKGLRVDTLAFDDESKAFVIIEYKRDKNFSVIDQGYAYLALLLNNKADFILQYNESLDSPLGKEEVDWSQSRVVFISPYFTPYQRKAIEFRDLPIELWEVKKYSNSIVLFNQIQVAEKAESITQLSQNSELVKSVSEEIVTYTEDHHVAKCDVRIRDIYKELKDDILSISPTVTVKIKKKYIAFVNTRNFIYLHPRVSRLDFHLCLKKGELNDPKNTAMVLTDEKHRHSAAQYGVSVDDKSDLGYVLTLIRQAYDKN